MTPAAALFEHHHPIGASASITLQCNMVVERVRKKRSANTAPMLPQHACRLDPVSPRLPCPVIVRGGPDRSALTQDPLPLGSTVSGDGAWSRLRMCLSEPQSMPANHTKASSLITFLPCHTGRHDACCSCIGARGRDFQLGIQSANPLGYTANFGASKHRAKHGRPRRAGPPGQPATGLGSGAVGVQAKIRGDHGPMLIRLHQPIVGKMRSITVFLQANQCHVSILVEQDVAEPVRPCGPKVGVDRDVVVLPMRSDGVGPYVPVATPRQEERKRRPQQGLSSKTRRSKNRSKAHIGLARHEPALAGLRKDALQKATTSLARNHRAVLVEDPRVKAMTASACGTLAEPAVNVAQKAGLNRARLGRGWGTAQRMLA
jgi:Probable transposase